MGWEGKVRGLSKWIAYCHFAAGEALKIIDAWAPVEGRSAYVSDKIVYLVLDDIPTFSDSNAVNPDRMYMIPGEFYSSPQFIIGYDYMSKWFRPDLFPDLDPQALHQEFLTRLMRVDIELFETLAPGKMTLSELSGKL